MTPPKKIPSSKLTWLAGKSPFSIGNTSSTDPFSIAMLVYQRVYDARYIKVRLIFKGEGFHLNVNLVGLKILKMKLYRCCRKKKHPGALHVLNFGRVFSKFFRIYKLLQHVLISTKFSSLLQFGTIPLLTYV